MSTSTAGAPAFEKVYAGRPRPKKPRDSGITVLLDWGMSAQEQANLLEMAADMIDVAKIAVGIAGTIPRPVLERKIELYKQHNVVPHPGGMYTEYAYNNKKSKQFFLDCVDLGFPLIEVSGPDDPGPKVDHIKMAREHGLQVIAQGGGGWTANKIVEDGERCLEAGAWKYILDRHDLRRDGQIQEDVLKAVRESFKPNDLVWEYVDGDQVIGNIELAIWFLETFGPEVNLANQAPSTLVHVEALRRGLGLNMLGGYFGLDAHQRAASLGL